MYWSVVISAKSCVTLVHVRLARSLVCGVVLAEQSSVSYPVKSATSNAPGCVARCCPAVATSVIKCVMLAAVVDACLKVNGAAHVARPSTQTWHVMRRRPHVVKLAGRSCPVACTDARNDVIMGTAARFVVVWSPSPAGAVRHRRQCPAINQCCVSGAALR
eukprot:jgi/Chrzof1/723/Cz01g26110.t1